MWAAKAMHTISIFVSRPRHLCLQLPDHKKYREDWGKKPLIRVFLYDDHNMSDDRVKAELVMRWHRDTQSLPWEEGSQRKCMFATYSHPTTQLYQPHVDEYVVLVLLNQVVHLQFYSIGIAYDWKAVLINVSWSSSSSRGSQGAYGCLFSGIHCLSLESFKEICIGTRRSAKYPVLVQSLCDRRCDVTAGSPRRLAQPSKTIDYAARCSAPRCNRMSFTQGGSAVTIAGRGWSWFWSRRRNCGRISGKPSDPYGKLTGIFKMLFHP